MLATINQTNDATGVCSTTDSFDLTDALITAYVAALPTPDHTLDLLVEYNGGDAVTISITDANPNLDNGTNTYTLTPDDVGQTTDLDDGIYSLQLRKTDTATGSTTSEYLCVFSDCAIKCSVDNCILKDGSTIAPIYHTVLSNLNTCDSCNCDDAVNLFDDLEWVLDNCSTIDDCGCQ